MSVNEKLQAKLKELPVDAGVYFFKNSEGKIIYIGKAAVLRNRVRQYFQNGKRADLKTAVMISQIADADWLSVKSEIEALFLESEMIKRYKPEYNILLRDDKHYQYVRINFKEAYPAVTLVRRPMDDGATYYGPYLAGITSALKSLRRVFPYSTHEVLPKRVCLQYHLGTCPGVEERKISPVAYKARLRKLARYLRGQVKGVESELEKQMKAYSKSQDFEKAAQARDQLRGLRNLRRQIVFSDSELFDVSKDAALHGLSELLKLQGIPRRIEAFDISHAAGTHNVASMVVFIDGVARKDEYRKFKMHQGGNDDFAHMYEAISRRFASRNLEQWPKPDLLLIDGGKGQLASALHAMEERGLSLPAIGLAKKREQVIVRDETGFQTINLPPDSHVLKLLMRVRDEAHRFAVSYHSLLRSKAQTSSVIESLTGIGPTTRKLLVKNFGSIARIKEASEADFMKLFGPKRGALIYHQVQRNL